MGDGIWGDEDYRGSMDALDHDSDWTFLEVVEITGDGSADLARADFLNRHPEIRDKPEWLRIDLMCGRDGTSALRFWVRKTAPPEPPKRQLP